MLARTRAGIDASECTSADMFADALPQPRSDLRRLVDDSQAEERNAETSRSTPTRNSAKAEPMGRALAASVGTSHHPDGAIGTCLVRYG